MKIHQGVAVAIIGGVCVVLAIHLLSLMSQTRELHASLEELQEKQAHIEEENRELEKDIEYLSYPHNVEKILREQFNYKQAGEKMIIVIPGE